MKAKSKLAVATREANESARDKLFAVSAAPSEIVCIVLHARAILARTKLVLATGSQSWATPLLGCV